MTLRRNTALNLAGHTLPLVAALVTIPAVVQLYGEQRYGALVLTLLLATYFGLAELGLSHAVAQRLASQPLAEGEAWRLSLTTGFWGSGALGLAGGAMAWVVGRLYFATPTAGSPPSDDLFAAIPWLLPLVPLCTMGAVLLASLQAQGRFLALNLVQGFGGVALLLAPWGVAVTVGADLSAAVAAIVAVRAAMLFVLWHLHPQNRRPKRTSSVSTSELRKLLAYGGWASVSATIGPLMVVLDRFVIGQQLGLRTVPTYAIPFQLAEKTTLLSSAINHALFPGLAAAESPAHRQEMALRAIGLLALVSAPPVALGVMLCGPFLSWWLPGELGVDGALVAQWLLVGFWLNGLALVPLTLLYAAGRPAVVARCHLIELAPYLVLLTVAVAEGGLAGAAIAFTVRALADLLMLSWGASMLVKTAFVTALSGLVILAAGVAAAASNGVLGTAAMSLAGIMAAAQLIYAARRYATTQ